MSQSDCTDVCEIIMTRLLGLGFTNEEIGMADEDHNKMIDALSKTKLIREPEERTWNTWVLSEDDIKEVAEQSEISLEGRDLDEIARRFADGVSSSLSSGWDWTDILTEAINNTPPEETEPYAKELAKSELRAMGGGDPYV